MAARHHPLNAIARLAWLVWLSAGASTSWSHAQGIFDFANAACPPTCIGILPPPLVPSVIPPTVPLPNTGAAVPFAITGLSSSHISGCFYNGQLCVHNLPVTIDAARKTATGKLGNLYFVFPLPP